MYRINISIFAKKDIKDCYDYIYDILKNDMAANKLLDEVEKSFRQLEIDPEHFQKTNDEFLDLIGIRYIKINNYLCFYEINRNNNEVNIIRFMYGKRNWKEILKDLP